MFGEQGDNVGGESLAGVELDEGAFAIDPLKAGQQRKAAEESIVLESLDIELEQGGGDDVRGLEIVRQRRDGDRGGIDFGGAGEECRLCGDGEKRGGIVARRDVHGTDFGRGADGGGVERDLGIAREEATKGGGRSWEWLEADDPRVGRPVTRGESELSAVRPDVDDGGERAGEHGAVLDAGEDAMPQGGAREGGGAKDVGDFGEGGHAQGLPEGRFFEIDLY